MSLGQHFQRCLTSATASTRPTKRLDSLRVSRVQADTEVRHPWNCCPQLTAKRRETRIDNHDSNNFIDHGQQTRKVLLTSTSAVKALIILLSCCLITSYLHLELLFCSKYARFDRTGVTRAAYRLILYSAIISLTPNNHRMDVAFAPSI